MKDWFTSLNSREQRFVTIAAGLVVMAMFYSFIWMPLSTGHSRMQAGVELWQTSLERIKPLNNIAGGNTAVRINPSNLNQPLVVVIDSTLRNRRLNTTLKRSQPAGDNIRVEFENVAFDELVLWLGDLSSQYALQVQSASFSINLSAKGRVNAQLTLGR